MDIEQLQNGVECLKYVAKQILKQIKNKMYIFNSIQIVILLMASPSLLSWVSAATFTGATALFWVGIIGTIILALFVITTIAAFIDKG